MISKLVSDLPEVYQPIYGHPELSGQVSRPCQDRFEIIARIHDALQRLLGRPLNVLDLGCAQGYISLNLAERGANVHGVDYLDKNIAVCKTLAQTHPQLKASFETGLVGDAIAQLVPGQYDLVLGLSVFHHIVYEKGVDEVKELLERAANQSSALIVELALHEEPLYWASAQPQDPRTLLETIAFVHEVAHHETHLSLIPRPLYVVSNRYWLLDGQAGQFDTWSTDPHALSHDTHLGSRRYFFGTDTFLKLYRFNHPRGAHNKTEFEREKQFLQNPAPGFIVPASPIFYENNTEGWLVTKRLPGKLLLDLLSEGEDIDHRAVLIAVLDQLATLEAAGLYHDDVRTWNVLVTNDGAVYLIDYGSISSKAQDCAWPKNLFLSFFVLVREVSTGVVEIPDPLRTISISPYGLPQPYCAWATALWRLPLPEWSFQLMRETLLQTPINMNSEVLQQPIEAWMKATEEAIQAQKLYIKHVGWQAEIKAQEAHAKAQQAEILVERAEAKAQEAKILAERAEAKAQEAKILADHAEAKAQEAETRAGQTETALTAIYKSLSWRVTAPLRWVGNVVRWFVRGSIAWLTFVPGSRPRRILRSAFICIKSRIYNSPLLKAVAAKLLSPFPRINARLSSIVTPHPTEPPRILSPMADGIQTIENLSPRARKIYFDLKAAIEQRQKEQR